MNPTRAPGTSESTASSMPTAGAEDRADGDLLARDAPGGRVLERRLDLDLFVREVLRRLVGEEERQLVHELAEHLRRRRDVAKQPELVLDQRMRNYGRPGRSRQLGGRHSSPRAPPRAERWKRTQARIQGTRSSSAALRPASATRSAPGSQRLAHDLARPRESRPRRTRASSSRASRRGSPMPRSAAARRMARCCGWR